MSESYTNLLYHIVFSTKERRPLITLEYEPRLMNILAVLAGSNLLRRLGGFGFAAGCEAEAMPRRRGAF